jgi:hypothetical protein
MSPAEIEANRRSVVAMFDSAFRGYMEHAFPHDELKPLSGGWTDSLIELGGVPKVKRVGYSGVALTLIDGMDTLAVMGNRTAFADAVRWYGAHVSFDQDAVVSVFETTVRAAAPRGRMRTRASPSSAAAHLLARAVCLIRDRVPRSAYWVACSPRTCSHPARWVGLRRCE